MTKELAKFGSPSTLVLYLDGQQPEEIQQTFTARNAIRKKAAIRCSKSLDTLEQRIQSNDCVRKRHFTDVKSALASAFYFSLTSRMELVAFLREAGYDARLCQTEVDVAFAKEFEEEDVVISCDSNMFAYANITILWIPISSGFLHMDFRVE